MINAFILQHKPFKPQIVDNTEDIQFIIVDLFCGAGGTTIGFDQARNADGRRLALIAACVNHDHKAIRSHWENHPEVYHFEEDIRTLELSPLIDIVATYRKLYPQAKIILWASLECTNFSKAKGGQARDADSRTLADHLDRYITAIDPDYIQIENVVEFMSWGPLNEKGKPVSMKSGQDWLRWRDHINSFGYRDEWREMNSADFGAYTSRNRLFGCFAKKGLPIVWPQPTHSKNGGKKETLFGDGLKKWKAVKDLLDFEDEGVSIFGRKKKLSDNTLDTIIAGIKKFVPKSETDFLYKYYGNGHNLNSVNDPAHTIPTKDRFGKICCILRNYKTGFNTSVETAIGALPTVPKANLLSFIRNPSHFGHNTSVDTSCPVIIARQDKAPLLLVNALEGVLSSEVDNFLDECDWNCINTPTLNKTKSVELLEVMLEYGISDIKMRMLKVSELKVIQGFPADYTLYGNQSDQKKFIGNSVVPLVVKCWAEAQGEKLLKLAA